MAQPQEKKLNSNFKWQAVLSKIEKIEEAPTGVFTSQREAERALSIYNRALEHIHSDNEDIARIALEKLVATYPLFTDAAVLYGLCLGADRKYKEAELQFKKALLADPDPADVEVLTHLQAQACFCKDRAEEEERSRRRNEKKLLPVRASLAQAGILERAAASPNGDEVRMASAKERDDLMRQISQSNKGSVASSPYGSRNKTVQIISAVIIIAALLFFLIYFLIAPAIAKANDRIRRLDWLEEKLVEGAETDEAFQVILDDYQRTFSE